MQHARVFISKYNHEQAVNDNVILTAAANRMILEEPMRAVQGVVKTLQVTIPEALRPSTDCAVNPFVNDLPWTIAYSWLLRGWRYVALAVAVISSVFWVYAWRWVAGTVRRRRWFLVAYAAVAVPLMVGNRYYPGQEDLGPVWTEITRQRIFVEPPLFVLGTLALWRVYRHSQSLRGESRQRFSARHG